MFLPELSFVLVCCGYCSLSQQFRKIMVAAPWYLSIFKAVTVLYIVVFAARVALERISSIAVSGTNAYLWKQRCCLETHSQA